MDTRRLEVVPLGPIPKGGVCILSDGPDPDDRAGVAFMLSELRRISGHNEFVVFVDSTATIYTGGDTPEEALRILKEAVRRAEEEN
jgi:hypothetical protein